MPCASSVKSLGCQQKHWALEGLQMTLIMHNLLKRRSLERWHRTISSSKHGRHKEHNKIVLLYL